MIDENPVNAYGWIARALGDYAHHLGDITVEERTVTEQVQSPYIANAVVRYDFMLNVCRQIASNIDDLNNN